MITQEEAERAQQFVFDKAEEIAESKAKLTYLTEFRKSKKSILSNAYRKANPKATIPQCEDYAYSHDEYIEVLTGIQIAAEEFEKLRFQIESARMKTNIWQTQSANQRV